MDRRPGFRDAVTQEVIIKITARGVTKREEARLWKLQYGRVETRKKTNPRFAFKKGDTVRISHVRQPFDRDYDEYWRVKYFVVADRGVKEGLPYYTLKDTTEEAVQATFYQLKLNSVSNGSDSLRDRKSSMTKEKRGDGEMDRMALEIQQLDTHICGGRGVSLSPRGTRQIFRFVGKRAGNVSPPFRQRPDRQRTAILLLFVSNPTRRHRHLRTVLPVLLQTETSRNGAASERFFETPLI